MQRKKKQNQITFWTLDPFSISPGEILQFKDKCEGTNIPNHLYAPSRKLMWDLWIKVNLLGGHFGSGDDSDAQNRETVLNPFLQEICVVVYGHVNEAPAKLAAA